MLYEPIWKDRNHIHLVTSSVEPLSTKFNCNPVSGFKSLNKLQDMNTITGLVM